MDDARGTYGGRRLLGAGIKQTPLPGVLGTFATAGLLASPHVILGFSWPLAGVIGAALAPTDPAVVFSALGGTETKSRAGTILEGEAGVTDPAGIRRSTRCRSRAASNRSAAARSSGPAQLHAA